MTEVVTLKHMNYEINKRNKPTVLVSNDTFLSFNQPAEKIWGEIDIDLLDLIGENISCLEKFSIGEKQKKTLYCWDSQSYCFESQNIINKVYLNL